MIVQIRGTSGSGKTYAMRQVMQQLGGLQPQYTPGRKRPLYLAGKTPAGRSVVVLGHYDIACGGCDTIGSVPQVFAVIERLIGSYDYILGEGLLLSEDVIWLEKYRDSRAVFLTTTVDECLRRVGERQQEKGRAPADPARVIRKLTKRVETIERARLRLDKAGILTRRAASRQAPGIVLKWLSCTLAGKVT